MSITRRKKRATAMEIVLSAIRNLIKLAANQLIAFRRLFGYRMSRTKRATYEVVHFYAKHQHPAGRRDWIPSELVEAMVLLGLKKYTRAKSAGELIRATGATDGVEQMVQQAVRGMFSFQRPVRFKRNRGPHMRGVRTLSRYAHRVHPYASVSTMTMLA